MTPCFSAACTKNLASKDLQLCATKIQGILDYEPLNEVLQGHINCNGISDWLPIIKQHSSLEGFFRFLNFPDMIPLPTFQFGALLSSREPSAWTPQVMDSLVHFPCKF
ncbi:hypothetical protein pdam_00006907 [Pocillopora damicornis]|uniref:Uncharacterized protein n=1 Tax=Pocillopora damicornis TaxID=46731 RepID=A0A3M6UA14_POCDA|nr:hypothetical protein pdam_00006907 [Pocillopora damicornis]